MSAVAREIWWPAYVALGANIDDPRRHVRQALDDLGALPSTHLLLSSARYRSRPMGPVEQPDFINAVAGLLTRLAPRDLLSALHGIEAAHGRRRRADERWGPRPLDLDLLAHGDHVSAEPDLRLPHPGIGERNFVLLPLASIAPDLEIPGLGRVGTLAGRIGRDGLVCLYEGSRNS